MTGERPRRIESHDLPELLQLCREHAEYERAPWIERAERVSDLASLLLESQGAHCWVIEGDGELAGFATAFEERSTWDAAIFLHLDCLYLRAAYRGRGLGRRLFDEVAAVAHAIGDVDVQWQTPEWNEDAQRFYARLGATFAKKLRFSLPAPVGAEIAKARGSSEPTQGVDG